MAQRHRLMDPIYTYCRAADVDDATPLVDAKGHAETWADMVRLQDAWTFPARFTSIGSPVLMLHGAYDPHPGPMIRDSLTPYLPQLEYIELEKCGHSPWIEAHARERFFAELRGWLAGRLGG